MTFSSTPVSLNCLTLIKYLYISIFNQFFDIFTLLEEDQRWDLFFVIDFVGEKLIC